MRILFSIIAFLGFGLVNISAQEGNISVKEEVKIEQMMQKFVEINKATTTIDGWRIQLLVSTDRRKVENEKMKFQSLFPNIQVDWSHSSPYYKLKAGAFMTKMEATRMLYVLKSEYPQAYTAKDNTIRPFELLN